MQISSIQEDNVQKCFDIMSISLELNVQQLLEQAVSVRLGSARKHSATHWCLQNIAQESVDSSDEEFFDARAPVTSAQLPLQNQKSPPTTTTKHSHSPLELACSDDENRSVSQSTVRAASLSPTHREIKVKILSGFMTRPPAASPLLSSMRRLFSCTDG
ncbi:hypothetical protein D9C73_014990 [Collichthys lucidus]|uniref:Uncharacterized protein n=1 Tax=Collichthys lucidus TaxID=240159 RepID=A0A4U5UZQ4_COLLU|nr:hypothetical protein D9C73_014990 [Collichthys lucidus]